MCCNHCRLSKRQLRFYVDATSGAAREYDTSEWKHFQTRPLNGVTGADNNWNSGTIGVNGNVFEGGGRD